MTKTQYISMLEEVLKTKFFEQDINLPLMTKEAALELFMQKKFDTTRAEEIRKQMRSLRADTGFLFDPETVQKQFWQIA